MSRPIFLGRYTAQLDAPVVSHRGIMMMQYWQSFEQLERFEGVYGNMPHWGMAAASNHVRIGAGREAAKERLRA